MPGVVASSREGNPRSYPISHDLRPNPVRQKTGMLGERGLLAIYIGIGLVLVMLGFLFYVGYAGGSRVIAAISAVAGVLFVGGMICGLRRTRDYEVVGLTLTERQLDFVRFRRPSLTIEWSDPALKINLYQFMVEPGSFLPKGVSRWGRRQWVDIYEAPAHQVKLRTTLPPEAFSLLLLEAERHNLCMRPIRVAFWWHTMFTRRGFLDYDVEGSLAPGRQVNGRIIQLRGWAWAGVPEA